jgi:hypothetical protein
MHIMPETKKKTDSSTAKTQLRTEKLEQIKKILAELHDAYAEKRKQSDQRSLLDSVSRGLYDELDKLSKKAPAEPITDLVLEHMNDVIRETKQLIVNDVYVQRLKECVAAGDNSQQRDALVLMRQVRDGLKRFETELNSQLTHLNTIIHDAESVECALKLFLSGKSQTISEQDMKKMGKDIPHRWQAGSYPSSHFDFDLLDDKDLPSIYSINE